MENKDYLKHVVSELSKPTDYKWKVQSFNKDKTKALCVAFLDARVVIHRLNEVCEYGWQRKHFAIGENVYCELGLVMPDGTVQWRSDVGESDNKTEKAKTSSSDSLKRSSLNFGLGLFLYNLEIVTLPTRTEGSYTNPVKADGTKIWDLTKYINLEHNKKAVVPVIPKQVATEPKPLQPSNEFNTLTDKEAVVPATDERKEKAKKALADLNNTPAILKHIIADLKLKHTSLNEFVDKEDIDLVLSVYSKFNVKK